MKTKQEDGFTLRCAKCNCQTLIVSFPEGTALRGLRCAASCNGRLKLMKFAFTINQEYYYKNYKDDVYKLDERGNFSYWGKINYLGQRIEIKKMIATTSTPVL